jgi:hypothetical protein
MLHNLYSSLSIQVKKPEQDEMGVINKGQEICTCILLKTKREETIWKAWEDNIKTHLKEAECEGVG